MACWSLSISSLHKVPPLDFAFFSSMADDTDTRCAIGFLKALRLESCTLDSQIEVHNPTLVIHVKMTDRIQSRNGRLRFRVPVQDLETLSQCQHWIKESLRSEAQLKFLAADIGNPKVLLGELIWNMKEKWGAGEICTGLVQMDVTKVGRREFCRRTAKMWAKYKAGQFEMAQQGSSSACCAVCLDVLAERSAVVELPCRHVFHCGCIADWLIRKSDCPLCRSRVQICYPFWVYMEKSAPALA